MYRAYLFVKEHVLFFFRERVTVNILAPVIDDASSHVVAKEREVPENDGPIPSRSHAALVWTVEARASTQNQG